MLFFLPMYIYFALVRLSMDGRYLGYALFVFGLLLILLALLLGYGLYISLSSYSQVYAPLAGSNSSIPASINNFSFSLSSQFSEIFVSAIKVGLFFLFAGVGYKFATIGMGLVESDEKYKEKNGKKDKKLDDE